MIRIIALCCGVVLVGLGGYQSVSLVSFLEHALPVQAEVLGVERLIGPPKPSTRVPLHVRFTLPDGSERQALTVMPLLRHLDRGDTVAILVDPRNPQLVRVDQPSVLWATPLTLLVTGILVLGIFGRVLRPAAATRAVTAEPRSSAARTAPL
jgi:hypothetical protein